MRECMNEVLNLINAKAKCIWINTYEEEAVINDMKEVSTALRIPMPIYVHSFATGIKKVELTSNKESEIDSSMGVDKLLKNIYNITRGIEMDEETIELMKEDNQTVIEDKNNIFILKDFHLMIDNPNIKRMFRDVVEGKYLNYNTIIIISPITEIPVEHEKLFAVIDYNTPDENLIKNILDAALMAGQRTPGFIPIDEKDKELIINSCKGLTLEEIAYSFRMSMVKNKTISVDEIGNYKIELIKKSNVLDYKIPNSNLNEIGGNSGFKAWVEEVIDAMTPEAIEFGCTKPKGYLALGVPGSAKTLLAEALAKSMSLPFLKLDMSKILDSKVGSSEKNMAQAIRMIKATAPCVLLIDEVEKTLSGMQSSGVSDAGTMARSIGAILEFLAEDHGVFVVMTSNDVSQLPPELTRAGRLDAIWYFGLPEENERKDIFNIHFNKLGKTVDSSLIDYAASITNDFTGAEIKEAVKNTLKKAFSRYKKDGNKEITKEDIQKACIEVIPVAKSSREKIAALNEYAKTRARFSNQLINEYGCNINNNKEITRILSIDDLKEARR